MTRTLLIFLIPLFTLDGLRGFVAKAREVAAWYRDDMNPAKSVTHGTAWAALADAVDRAIMASQTRHSFDEATVVFDLLSGAIYYGLAFKDVLVNDPEAMIAAHALVERLKLKRVPGMGEPPSSKRKA